MLPSLTASTPGAGPPPLGSLTDCPDPRLGRFLQRGQDRPRPSQRPAGPASPPAAVLLACWAQCEQRNSFSSLLFFFLQHFC